VLAAPILVGVGYSVGAGLGLIGVGAAGSLDFARIGAVFTDPVVLEGTGWTLWIAASSTAVSAVLAALLATAFRGSSGLSRLGRLVAILPLPLPHVVAGLAGLLVLGQSGLFARIAFHVGLIEGPAGMPALVYDRAGLGLMTSLVWKETPFLTLVAGSVLATRGNVLEQTARGLGAGAWVAFRRVTWPVLWRGMLPACVAVFTFVAGNFEVAVLLAPSDPLALPLLTWERYTGVDLSQRPEAFILALLGLALAVAAVAAHEWISLRGTGRAEAGSGGSAR
jgi:putative spermidine/putrescine transport system permease protein